MLLAEKRRVELTTEPQEWLESALLKAPMNDAPLTREVAIQSRILRFAHQDPADRFLAATAQVHDLTLVTEDEHLLKAQGFRKLANRRP